MKDLYARLKVGLTASEEEIIHATSDPSRGTARDRRDAKAVLLVPTRRRQYDRIREAAAIVGRLRATLGMQPGTRRHPDFYEDFARPFSPPPAHRTATPPPHARPAPATPPGAAAPSNGFSFTGIFWTIVVVAGLGYGLANSGSSQKVDTARQAAREVADRAVAVDAAPAFSAPVLPLPATGAFDNSSSTTQNAIIVKTRAGKHTLVKIEDLAGTEITRGFIRGGDSYQFDLGRGTYVIKMAWGTQWYGGSDLFGPDTGYSKADDTFALLQYGEQWTVELIPQTSGNLREVNLRPEQF